MCHTIQHRAVLIIFLLYLQTITITRMLSSGGEGAFWWAPPRTPLGKPTALARPPMVTNSSRKREGEDKEREGNYKRGGEEDWMPQGWVGLKCGCFLGVIGLLRALSRPTQRDPPEFMTMRVSRLKGKSLSIYVASAESLRQVYNQYVY